MNEISDLKWFRGTKIDISENEIKINQEIYI